MQKRCPGGYRLIQEDSQVRLYWEEGGTVAAEGKFDDDPNPVVVAVDQGFRRKAKVLNATLTWLRLDVEGDCVTLSRLATYRGCALAVAQPEKMLRFPSASRRITGCEARCEADNH